MNFRLVLLLLAFCLVGGPLRAQVLAAPLPAGVQRTASVEGITEYTLTNGLRVLFAPDATKPTTTVNTTFLVGSRHESYGETGMAHLLEHLYFKGTPTYPGAWLEYTKRGLRANGSTSPDRTNYYASFAANEDNLDWYLRWSADAMTQSFIAKKDLDSEMTVVRNEMEMGENNPTRQLIQRVMDTAYSWHNYGKSTIGARSDVENVRIERLQAFYRKYYQPDNAVLIVSGKFDEAKTLALIVREFGKIPKPTRVIDPTYTIDPVQQGERSVTVRRTSDTQVALAMYHTPPAAHPDYAAVSLLADILGNSASGRLYKALVETKQAASVFAFAWGFREPGPLFFGAQVPLGSSLETARDTLLATVESIDKQGITEAEVERARTRLLRSFELTLADPERIGVALSESIAQGDWRVFFLQRDRVRSIKAADVQRVATQYLLRDNRTLGLFVPTPNPQRAPAPTTVDVGPMVKDYRGDPPVSAGEAFDATPDNIEKRTERGSTADGLQYALLSKRTRGATVSVRFSLRTGSEHSLAGTAPAGELTAAMLARGAAGLSRADIQEQFDKLKTRFSISGGSTRTTVSLESTREKLPEAMELVAKLLRRPDFPAAEFDQIRLARLTAIESQRLEPDSLARNALARHGNPYTKGDVRYEPSQEELMADTKAMDVARLRAFHRDFYGVDKAEFAAVGDFDAAALKAQLGSLFAGFKAAKPHARVPQSTYVMPPVEMRIRTPDKANAFFFAQTRFPLRDDSDDYAAALVASRIVGGGTGSILWKRIRETDGTSYSVGASLAASSHDAHATWTAFAIYAPQNVKRLEDAFRQELARVTREGFTPQELQEAKSGLAQLRRLSLAQDTDLASALTSQLELGRKMDHVERTDRAIAAVTLEQANAAFRRYVDPAKLALVFAGDFDRK